MFDLCRLIRKTYHFAYVARQPRHIRLLYSIPRLTELLRHSIWSSFYRSLYMEDDGASEALTSVCRGNSSGFQFLPPVRKKDFILSGPDTLVCHNPEQLWREIRFHLGKHGEFKDAYPISPFASRIFRHYVNLLAYRTSGSSGRPVTLVQPMVAVEDLFALQIARGCLEPKTFINGVRRLLGKKPVWVALLRGKAAIPSISLLSNRPQALKWLSRQIVLDLNDPWDKVKANLAEIRPSYLSTYPQTMLRLAREGFRVPGLRLAVSMSEEMDERDKAAIERGIFEPGIRGFVGDHYASGECPHLTTACPYGQGAHVNDDVAVLETGNQDVLVTNLLNLVQPIIRYRIDDHVEMKQSEIPCVCGSQMPLVTKISREDDKLVVQGVALSPAALKTFFLRYPILEFQVQQRSERNLVLIMVSDTHLSPAGYLELRTDLLRLFSLYGIDIGKINLTLEYRESIDPDPATGKTRRMVKLF